MRSVLVVVGESGEGDLGFPGHIGVSGAFAVLQNLDHAPTVHIESFARVACDHAPRSREQVARSLLGRMLRLGCDAALGQLSHELREGDAMLLSDRGGV